MLKRLSKSRGYVMFLNKKLAIAKKFSISALASALAITLLATPANAATIPSWTGSLQLFDFDGTNSSQSVLNSDGTFVKNAITGTNTLFTGAVWTASYRSTDSSVYVIGAIGSNDFTGDLLK